MKKALLAILLIVALAAISWIRLGSGDGAEPVHRTRLLMGTVVEITASGQDRDATEAAVSAAFSEMERIESLMSPHLPGSEVARLSVAREGDRVSPETAEVLRLALEIAKASGGAFDPALGRLKELWGVERENPRIPSPEEIRTALRGTGPGALTLQGERVDKADPELAVDLGGVAKGYAVDRATEVLRGAGVTAAAVNAGGDIRILGDRKGRPWRIGIQHPRRPEAQLAVLELTDAAVVTSGDYERYFERDGRRYHHLFDPATGYPADRSRSVTVVAPTAALADALATAAFVLGPEEGLALLSRFGAEGVLVGADGEAHITANLGERIQWR